MHTIICYITLGWATDGGMSDKMAGEVLVDTREDTADIVMMAGMSSLHAEVRFVVRYKGQYLRTSHFFFLNVPNARKGFMFGEPFL